MNFHLGNEIAFKKADCLIACGSWFSFHSFYYKWVMESLPASHLLLLAKPWKTQLKSNINRKSVHISVTKQFAGGLAKFQKFDGT